jgi:RNA polymerase sigma-70 factor (ECF subfamily)
MMTHGTNYNLVEKRRLNLDYRDNTVETLIQRAKTQPEDFARLFRMNYDTVFRYCSRRLFDRHCAEDVTSNVFMKIMRNLSSFQGGEADFRNWLYRIATNAVNDHLRTAARRADAIENIKKDFCAESAYVITDNPELQEKKAFLKEALLSLKPKYQTVIALRFFENMKLTEIAACLDKKPATVRSWLSRALVKLRKNLSAAINNKR